jgi:hypothetical protein
MHKQDLGGVTTSDFCKFGLSGEPLIPFGGLPTTQEQDKNDFSIDPHYHADGFGWTSHGNLLNEPG